MSAVKFNDRSGIIRLGNHAPQGNVSRMNDSCSIDRDGLGGMDDDECNLINNTDFEEGKSKDIVTARATPIKSNALARKNLSTARKLSHNLQSPNLHLRASGAVSNFQ